MKRVVLCLLGWLAALRQEPASTDDCRHHVADEVEINAMRSMHCPGAMTRSVNATLRKNYLDLLRCKAVIEPLPA